MTLSERLSELVQACFTGLWVQSCEPQEAKLEIATLCREEGWCLVAWNIETGYSDGEQQGASASDPLAAIRSFESTADPSATTILVLENFHRFMQSAEIVQAMTSQIIRGKQTRTIVIVLAPVIQIPIELQKLFTVVQHELPGRDQLEAIAREIATEEGELPDSEELENVLDAASGLTRLEAENAFSLSLVRTQRIAAETIWELKTQTLQKSGLVSLYRGGDDFYTLGGLSALKDFCLRALRQPSRDNPLKRARGVMLLSPPGCGKSQFAKSLGKEVGRPVITLDVGGLMGSLVGQSEERTRKALQIIDAMAPCVLMVDEIEKAFAGVGANNDSGVSSRMFGSFIQWLNDHETDVFVVCTSNDISQLPPELARSERFDGVFFIDLPNRDEKDVIWDIYLDVFELDRKLAPADDIDWTGSEIKACCRLAALLDVTLEEASQNVVPIAVTAAESLEKLRTWASGRCLAADHPGVYRYRDESGGNPRRRIPRDPSLN